ncbi:MAG: hypothetical protein HS105_05745 [Chloracidobacterium sp.]|nr:hypothetical protein [Chloracidobacterium sp.]
MNKNLTIVEKDELLESLGSMLDEKIKDQLWPLNSVIAVKQKEACLAAGITDDTARNRVAQGKVTSLQRDGSRLVNFTLEVMPGLKPRTRRKKDLK